MARVYAARHHLPSAQLDELLDFAALRNAISHGKYYGGRPIAEPTEEVVRDIERLREQILSPPLVLDLLEERQVCVTGPDEPISAVLEHVVRFDYSQVPVYSEASYVGLLTTNAVARWLARQFELNQGLAEGEPVRRVLAFAESHERARLAGRTITAAEAIYHLTHSGRGRAPVPALIVTEGSEPAGRPLRMITGSDLPALSAKLGIGITGPSAGI